MAQTQPQPSTSAVLITGAARRVGRVLALAFADAGYDIAIHYNTSKSEAEALEAEVRAGGREAACFAQDLAKLEALPDLIERVRTRFPHCRTLINNASLYEKSTLPESTPAHYRAMFDVNFAAPLFLTRAFCAEETQQNLHIINMLDTSILKNRAQFFFYLLSKKALASATETLAVEFGPRARVNGICPGIVLPSGYDNASYMEKLGTTLPLRKTATPEDVAATALMLERAPALTGQMIFVDGGEHATLGSRP